MSRMLKAGFVSLLSVAMLLGACNTPPSPVVDFEQMVASHQQSPIVKSVNATDWALDGVGYFALINQADQKTYYTRNGRFHFDSQGKLVNQDGYVLEPAISLGESTDFSHIDESGVVWGVTSKQTQTSQVGDDVQLGKITIVMFKKPEALKALAGRDGLYEATSISGKAQSGLPGQNGYGMVLGQAYEDFSQAAGLVGNAGCASPQTPKNTGRVLDLSIQGVGFFRVLNPISGESFYTRKGAFTTDTRQFFQVKGQLMDAHGYPVDPVIHLTAEQTLSRIDENGVVWAKGGDDSQETKVGELELTVFSKPEALKPVGYGRNAVFKATAEAGEVKAVKPGQNGAARLKMGELEDCGIDLIAQPK